jgi:hypothetical protein
MKVVTVLNVLNNIGYSLLRLSCALNDLELIVLVSKKKEFTSNRIKDDLLKNYLTHEVGPEEVILFTDGIDTVLMSREDEILAKFQKTGRDLLFSCETLCWPDPSLADSYPSTARGPYRYLNSGGFVGKAGVIKELLEEEPPGSDNFGRSNQYVWAKRYFAYPDVIGLDHGCELFHTFSPEICNDYLPNEDNRDHSSYYNYMKSWFKSNYIIQRNRIYSKISGTWPCQAHFNGASKCLMDGDVISMIFGMIPGLKQPLYIHEAVPAE